MILKTKDIHQHSRNYTITKSTEDILGILERENPILLDIGFVVAGSVVATTQLKFCQIPANTYCYQILLPLIANTYRHQIFLSDIATTNCYQILAANIVTKYCQPRLSPRCLKHRFSTIMNKIKLYHQHVGFHIYLVPIMFFESKTGLL